MNKNQQIAQRILKEIGGSKNINNVTHCATRLRFELKDESKVNKQRLQNDLDVIQIVECGDQFQVVIGTQVSEVYQELIQLGSFNKKAKEVVSKKSSFFNRLINVISSIFTPFLGAMASAGILKGFLTLAVTLGWLTETSGVYIVFFAVADGIFIFLPIILALTAAKKFKTNEYLAIGLAMGLVHPMITALAGDTLNFLGIPVIIGLNGYLSSVLPIILAVYLQSYLERIIKQVIPSFLQTIFVPLMLLIIMAPITFIIIGPLGTTIGNVLGSGYDSIYSFSPLLAGAIIGGFWQIFVMLGMHWGFVPIPLLNLAQNGYDTMSPILLPSVIAQGGSALAVFFMTKNVKLKNLALSSTITAFFGITEPTVYGVNLPLKKPFIAGCIGGAVGGAIIGGAQVKSFTFGLMSFLILPSFIPQDSKDMSGMLIALLATIIAFVLAFVLTIIFRFQDEPIKIKATEVISTNEEILDEIIISPLAGKVTALTKVGDEVFSSGIMGTGIAIEPSIGKVVAPFDAKVQMLFPTHHAIGLRSTTGIELFIHIGIDTVNLAGEGFVTTLQQDDFVHQGETLIDFDIKCIERRGLSATTVIIVTNSSDFTQILSTDKTEVTFTDDLLILKK